MQALGADIDYRSRTILEATVEQYIRTGEPVASRAVARVVDPPVSSATARTVMARLEASGFLRQPHTSAGRSPTDRGYRVYVDGLQARWRQATPPRLLDAELGAGAAELGMKDYLRFVSGFLSQRSSQVGVVVSPQATAEVLERLQFVRLWGPRVMVLAVSRLGAVNSRVLETEAALDDDEIARLQDALNVRLRGRTMGEARRILASEARRLRASPLLARDLPLGGVLPVEKAQDAEVFVEGVANMLRPEPATDLARLRRALEALERRHALAHFSDVTRGRPGVTVRIGCENEPDAFEDLALIACGYGRADGAEGSLGVLGPKRMDYSRLIPLVAHTADQVSAFVRDRSQETT